MDPILNPYAPGAGSPPPELAGRNAVREKMSLCIERLRRGKPAKSMMLVGLRGVGKTVLLDQMMKDAEATGVVTIRIEVPEGRSLPAALAPQLRRGLLKLSRMEKAKDVAIRGLRALAGFVGKMKITFNDIEVGLDYEAEPGLADNGDLEGDLTMLLEQVGRAAQAASTLVAIFIDELQYVPEQQMVALISALHRCSQLQLPLVLVGAGLPQLRGRMGKAKSYAERLFDFPAIGPLEAADATSAIVKPALSEGVDVDGDAVALILNYTKGYPYFLQEWGKHAWDVADTSPISKTDVETASTEAVAALDESFFQVRFDRLTPAEKKYLRAMAELGNGPHRSGDIAAELGRESSSLGPVRSSLISKGMVWSPTHGDTAFTVPLFDEFMKRTMPGEEWANAEN
ncbi:MULTISPECIES: ATP-binding protein [unclassified Undibacterium]|uniref:ATP-binding protein n=1 Tax=unclassified Undibacterium TaxID=2630295 RepID=UPI002AC8B871|nr:MULTISPECIES: AAA family ATPase [unclassified Undibacterium]MEB0139986.1 AAA family ATPase [Undibacterium sp. CCC2.1]MEB0173006.1 AAA family ATPase [Undibacterium sp. CCC1.1]MEB0176840.1 AAA family ATPase [Undibacterium sp. CCC3.4]MEB0216072.1 AAA family ATPase [Undibacterium sp. 5I2]WPX42218.1 AAA family ATPase [Undibacterium sp. CCC3.4]